MSTIYKIIACCILPFCLYGQQAAFFETTIYFEDAVGNIDSVVVGMDEEANFEYNPQFGEADIEAPWDSVFEVRTIGSRKCSSRIEFNEKWAGCFIIY